MEDCRLSLIFHLAVLWSLIYVIFEELHLKLSIICSVLVQLFMLRSRNLGYGEVYLGHFLSLSHLSCIGGTRLVLIYGVKLELFSAALITFAWATWKLRNGKA